MKEYQSYSHTMQECKYHATFIPKRRKKRIFGADRKHLGEMLHGLAEDRDTIARAISSKLVT